jgi:hypothetical protein
LGPFSKTGGSSSCERNYELAATPYIENVQSIFQISRKMGIKLALFLKVKATHAF